MTSSCQVTWRRVDLGGKGCALRSRVIGRVSGVAAVQASSVAAGECAISTSPDVYRPSSTPTKTSAPLLFLRLHDDVLHERTKSQNTY